MFDYGGASRIVRNAVKLGMGYADAAQVYIRNFEYAYRAYSMEFNSFSNVFTYVRLWKNGVWRIFSCNSDKFSDMYGKADVSSSTYISGLNVDMAEQKPVRGTYLVGDEEFPSEESVKEIFSDIVNALKIFEKNGRLEVILNCISENKFMYNSDGSSFIHSKTTYELYSYVVVGNRSIGEYVAYTNIDSLRSSINRILDSIAEKLNALKKTRYLNPFYKHSRFDVILDPYCSGALFHEVVHMLEADRVYLSGGRSPVGSKVFPRSITVIDDPYVPSAVGSFIVDDEGVKASPRKLIEDGVIVDLLHNRWTAKLFKSEKAGNARGLSIPPRPMQSNLVVKPGDWRVDEIIEETKEGFLLIGLERGELQRNSIAIYPELTLYIKDGETRENVILERILIPIPGSLRKIDAVSRNRGYRSSVEKGFPMSEVAPYIRIRRAVVE
ncbi:MAG: hypothetical protein B6U94_03890 [Thermofilum sp. ex4484_79]|nr:MAG: hypothetical protein B6U94_03890 [Thermofilum sp. ex4484_79]